MNRRSFFAALFGVAVVKAKGKDILDVVNAGIKPDFDGMVHLSDVGVWSEPFQHHQWSLVPITSPIDYKSPFTQSPWMVGIYSDEVYGIGTGTPSMGVEMGRANLHCDKQPIKCTVVRGFEGSLPDDPVRDRAV